MTKTQAVNKLLTWAAQQVGYREGANNWNKYAPLWTTAGGWNVQNQPWCDVFVDVAFIECFGLEAAAQLTYQPVGGFSAGCAVSASYFQKAGAFVHSPQPGDQVFFYSGGGINHTGIVVRVDGGTVETIEGNSSDSVARRYYSVSDTKIAGYGRPRWDAVTAEPVSESDTEEVFDELDELDEPDEPVHELEICTVGIPELQFGDCGAAVAALQAGLKHLGYDPTWIDGEFGERTHEALKLFQSEYGLEPELGICAEGTWEMLMRG